MIEINHTNYYSPEAAAEYMGASQFKAFQKCEAAALASIKGEYEQEQTTALLVGSYVDAHFEGTLDIFKAKHPDIFKKDGKLKSDYLQADDIITRIENDDLFMTAMDGEKQKIMTGEIEGIPFKIKIDSYREGKTIVDLKCVKDFRSVYAPERGRLPFYEFWGYDIQGAIYREIVRQNTGENLPFVLACATKEKDGTDIAVFSLDPAELEAALQIVKENVVHFDNIKKGREEPKHCGHCAYCRLTKKLDKVLTSEEFNHEYSD